MRMYPLIGRFVSLLRAASSSISKFRFRVYVVGGIRPICTVADIIAIYYSINDVDKVVTAWSSIYNNPYCCKEQSGRRPKISATDNDNNGIYGGSNICIHTIDLYR